MFFISNIFLLCIYSISLSRHFLQTNKDFNFRFERAFDCQPDNETYPARVSMNGYATVNQTFHISGTIHVSDKMPMNLELEVSLKRCSIDKTGCRSFGKFVFSRLCEKLTISTSIAYKIAQAVVPTPICPFAQRDYEISNGTSYTLNFMNMIPLDGYYWKLHCMFYEKKGVKRIKTISCVQMDVSFSSKSTHKN